MVKGSEAKSLDAQVCRLVDSVGGAPLVVHGIANVWCGQVKSDGRVHERGFCMPLPDESIIGSIQKM